MCHCIGVILTLLCTGNLLAQSADPHAAHKAAMSKPNYTVTNANY